MAKLVLTMTMSLDGFFSGPDGELDWMTQAPDLEFSRDNVAFFDHIDRGFIGYPTASGMLPYWMNVTSDPQTPADQRALAEALNNLRPFLISHREEPVPWPNVGRRGAARRRQSRERTSESWRHPQRPDLRPPRARRRAHRSLPDDRIPPARRRPSRLRSHALRRRSIPDGPDRRRLILGEIQRQREGPRWGAIAVLRAVIMGGSAGLSRWRRRPGPGRWRAGCRFPRLGAARTGWRAGS